MKSVASSLLLVLSPLAFGQQVHSLQDSEYQLGSHIRPVIAESAMYPLNKRYEDFSLAERATVRAIYENMPEGDEPPFPRDGLKSFIYDLHSAAGKRQASGILSLLATVAATGEVEKVEIFASPDEQFSRYAAVKLGQLPFKPAICGGVACKMQFMYRVKYELRHR